MSLVPLFSFQRQSQILSKQLGPCALIILLRQCHHARGIAFPPAPLPKTQPLGHPAAAPPRDEHVAGHCVPGLKCEEANRRQGQKTLSFVSPSPLQQLVSF